MTETLVTHQCDATIIGTVMIPKGNHALTSIEDDLGGRGYPNTLIQGDPFVESQVFWSGEDGDGSEIEAHSFVAILDCSTTIPARDRMGYALFDFFRGSATWLNVTAVFIDNFAPIN